jgi:hypothetical protein
MERHTHASCPNGLGHHKGFLHGTPRTLYWESHAPIFRSGLPLELSNMTVSHVLCPNRLRHHKGYLRRTRHSHSHWEPHESIFSNGLRLEFFNMTVHYHFKEVSNASKC